MEQSSTKYTIKKGTNRATLSLYWQQMRKYKLSLLGGVIFIPTSALLLDTALPYFLSQAIGTFNKGGQGIEQMLLFACIAAAIGVLFNLIGFQSIIHHESGVRRDLHNYAAGMLLSKDADFFANQKIGALTGRLIDFVNAHVDMQDLFVIRTLSFLFAVGGGLVVIAISSPLLGLVVLGLILLIIAQVEFSIHMRRPLRHRRKELIAELNGVSADAITNNMTVKTFAQEEYEISLINRISGSYQAAYRQDFRKMSSQGTLRLAIMAGVQIIAIVFIIQLIQKNQMSIGVAIFTIAYLQRIASNLFSLGEMINGYDKLFLQAAPMTEILISDNKVTDIKNAKNIHINHGAIEFKDVTYAYDDAADSPVIQNLSLTIPAGQKVGIVGHSGAGKTTLTRLLLRFADVNHGTIAIDGQNTARITQNSLRQSISYVPQEPILFHRTLRQNIAYSRPDASEAEVIEAAKKANAYDFIEKLPQGLDTIVGERGIKLSGGQRQRIALARAILKDSPILILDEATSSLDSVSEKLIQDALRKLMANRTSIVVAHRLSTIAALDRIIVLDKGTVVEDGTHQELLNQDGVYSTLWKHQSGAFIK